jgi:hypothetical protein
MQTAQNLILMHSDQAAPVARLRADVAAQMGYPAVAEGWVKIADIIDQQS